MNKNAWIGLVVGLVVVLGMGAGLYFYQVNGANEDKMNEPTEIMSDENETEEMMDESVQETMMNKGNAAPDFTLMDTKGNTLKLSDLKGEKVYIKFWASWCSICLAGLDEFEQLAIEEQGFKVISIVSPGYKGEQSQEDFVNWFSGVDAKDLTVLLDVGGEVASAYGVRAYPTSAYIGSDGILVKTLPGHVGNEGVKMSMDEIK